MVEWGRKGWGRFPGAQPDIGLEPWLLRLDLGCCIPSFWIESFWDGCRGCGSRPSPPGKAVRKGTAFVLRSNSMMSFSPSGKCLSWTGACSILVKRLKHEASLIDQPRPSHVHPTLPSVSPHSYWPYRFIMWMDSIEETSRSCRLLQGLSQAFLDRYPGCILEPSSIADELRVSSNPWCSVATTKPSECQAFPQDLCFLSVKKSLRNLSGLCTRPVSLFLAAGICS